MKGFIATLKKNQNNAFYIDIPSKIMQEQKLKPYMTAKIKANKKDIWLPYYLIYIL